MFGAPASHAHDLFIGAKHGQSWILFKRLELILNVHSGSFFSSTSVDQEQTEGRRKSWMPRHSTTVDLSGLKLQFNPGFKHSRPSMPTVGTVRVVVVLRVSSI